MKAVIVSSSYSYLERVELLKEYYDSKGYDTTVLLTDFIHANKEYATWEKEGYVLIQTYPYQKNISVARLYSHHKFAKDVAAHLEQLDIDILHVLLPANSLAKVARQYKEKYPNVRLHLDIIDLWPETMPISRFKRTYPFEYWRSLRDDNLDNADTVYCECNLFIQVMKKQDDKRFKTLYWIKTTNPIDTIPMLSKDELHLCYLGSINNVIDIDYIVTMCMELGKHRKVVLHIVGDGEKREELLKRMENTEAEVIYHGFVFEPEKKQSIFDVCHFGLNIMKPSVCVGLTMKSLDYFQAGLPIINNIQGDTADMVDTYKIGFNGYQELLERLQELQDEDFLVMRQNVKKLYYDKFTKEAFVKRLEENDESSRNIIGNL